MVAKISLGNSLYGAICYNGEKINKEKGRLLDTNKIYNDGSGSVNIHRVYEDFMRWMPSHTKTEKPMMHISLNPHPDDRLSDTDYTALAHEYMQKMGLGDMPYLIFKHMDIDRHHIHIVALRVGTDGKAISDKNNFYRSKDICRELERKYNLHTAERQRITPDMPIRKIDLSGDIKRQVANTVKMVGMRYKFQTIGEYNAILGLYNIRCEQTDGRVNGREYHGLVYFATDDNGNTIASPFKASRLGKFASRTAIDGRMERAKDKIDIRPTKQAVSEAMAESSGKDDFIAKLKERNIDLILRHTDTGRIYGATFIDHNTRTVLNGSRLGKHFSANALEQWFTAGERPSVVPVQTDTRQEQPQPDTQPSQPDSQQPDAGNTQSNTAGQQTTGGTGTSQGQRPGQGQAQQQFRQGDTSAYDEMPSIPGLDLFHTGPGFDAEEEAFYRAMQRRKKKNAVAPDCNFQLQFQYIMSQQEDDLRALAKIMDFMRGISFVLVAANMLWFTGIKTVESGWFYTTAYKILNNLDNACGLFHNPNNAKWFALLLLALSCFGTKGVKKESIRWKHIIIAITAGMFLYFGCWWMPAKEWLYSYIICTVTGYVALLFGGVWMGRMLKGNLMDDRFNNENESFMQETELKTNDYSVNLPTRFYYNKRWNKGWINVVNPFRATIVLGTPGSGKSYAVVNNYIKQCIEKGYSAYIYDFKFPDLSVIAMNHLNAHTEKYNGVVPEFRVINFDDPMRSHRCNPIAPEFMTDISDAYESAYTIMLNLNKTWVSKQGDFFVESPIILLAAIIWFLRIYKDGEYCTFPHAIEFLCRPYEDIFPILTSYPELENYLSPFMDAWLGGAQEQLQGQIASAKIPLTRMISPQLYWVMSASEFSLDINNPEHPKILCVGNNPDRQNIYGAALGLYNSRIVKLINKKNRLKSAVIIDELPTIYFKGLDNLIATARSNKVAVCLGFQDFSQLKRDYGDKEAAVVMNTVGNIFSGQVVGETAKTLSERFGKVLQKRQSVSINRQDVSHSFNTQMDSLIPPSKISTLTQGMFVGAVSDNFDERIDQKIFHAEIVVDNDKVKAETARYAEIPVINPFIDKATGECVMQRTIQDNYDGIKKQVKKIVFDEIRRIAADPLLKHLLKRR